MQSQNSSSGENVMKNFKYWLFHLSCELCSHNDHLLLSEIQCSHHWRTYSFNVWRDTHLTAVKDVNVSSGCEIFFQFLLSWSSEHISHKQSMISSGTDSSDFNLMIRVPSCITIDDDASALVVDVINGHFFNHLKLRFFKWNVWLSPIDCLRSNRVSYNSWIMRLSSCLQTGISTKCSIRSHKRWSCEGVSWRLV